ncbi:Transposon Ty3-G Gag-Pol poly [Labeo rohita]|uniref:Transposon Ty3-G Gag-Pol poly n=1 Tax=Labeo rohita TaxID=84645 RepID=A0A498L8S7_LABRO|nr:Transposon Ty3-G Gag-Pol poly [Labeo rohita]RXN18064.1 Transposon Ty3-G Gag-Pol poly [Labeo rohita]
MLEGCRGVVCHADDILVYNEDMHSHNERLCGVLKRLQEEGRLNEKCVFAADNIMFVGHHITAKGVAPDPGKVRAMMEMPEPTGVEGVRRLLGMSNGNMETSSVHLQRPV